MVWPVASTSPVWRVSRKRQAVSRPCSTSRSVWSRPCTSSTLRSWVTSSSPSPSGGASPLEQHTYLASNFLVPNASFIAELVAFLIILWAITKYVVPPLAKSMNERQELIRPPIEESKEAREKLEKAEQEYKDALKQARQEANEMKEQARAEGARIRADLEKKAREDAANIAAANQRQM